jgi:flagellar biosynthetic protein FliQ
MDISEALFWGQQALTTVALISGPVLLTALVVGLTISLFQAVTQVHEMTLVFVPKIAAVFFVFSVMGGWMLNQAVNFATLCFESISETTR